MHCLQPLSDGVPGRRASTTQALYFATRWENRDMAQGSKKKYSSKQKRQAEHIAEGCEDRGTSKKEAKRRAWATVNKDSGGGKKSGSGRGKKKKKSASKKGGRKGGAAKRGKKEGAKKRRRKKPGPKKGSRKKKS
jgi:hypothetical protein